MPLGASQSVWFEDIPERTCLNFLNKDFSLHQGLTVILPRQSQTTEGERTHPQYIFKNSFYLPNEGRGRKAQRDQEFTSPIPTD